jgi:DNA-binding NarL/FixJ family response regulator
MKLLLVAERQETKENLAFHLLPLGIEIIHYLNPLKAMDNIDEIDPQIVLFSSSDFPRHWKPFLRLLRDDKARHESIFILLRGEDFSVQEAAKAVHLEVNGIISEMISADRIVNNLEEILLRYGMIKDRARKNRRYLPSAFDDLEFILTHPQSLKVVTGMLADISLTGARFIPDNPKLTEDLERGSQIPTCSLQVGEAILAVSCKLVRNEKYMGLQFLSLSDKDMGLLKKYLDSRAERALASQKVG